MLPERFGRYEVLAEIGEGAMGRVYSAWDHKVSRLVAVKTVKNELLTSETADDYLKRFRREAIAAGALNHPQVVRIFDVGDDFLVMEFVEGRTLHAMIRAAGRIAPAETRRLLGPVADALDHAHRAGIVHRDVKPANVMVQPDGEPKLMDFGVAHFATSVMTMAGQVLGSPTYMSPEQIEGGAVSGRSDVYSLAVVAYEMLTGQPPFQGQSITQVIYRVMYENPPSPRRWNAALPARYDDVFAMALAKDPARRFASASEFTAALDLRELEHVLGPVGGVRDAEPSMDDAPTVLERPLLVPTGAAGRARKGLRPAQLLPATLLAALAIAGIGWAALRLGSPATLPTPLPPSPLPPAAVLATPATAAPAPAAPTPSAPPLRTVRIVRSDLPTPAPSEAPLATPEPVAEGQLVELADDVTPPVRIHGGPAPYPEAARRLRAEGTVLVAMIVDDTGTPTELQVVESAGRVLDAAVIESVRAWRFEPATKQGVKVKVRWTARQTYRTGR